MLPRKTRLKIPRMCDEGPPSYSEAEMTDRHRLRREAALARVDPDATHCVHYSSLWEILNSQDLADRIARYPEGDLTHIEYFHQVPADTPRTPGTSGSGSRTQRPAPSRSPAPQRTHGTGT